MKTLITTLLITFLINTAEARVHNIQNMKDIASYVDQNTMVVFDIDNTLAHPPQDLGSGQSWKWMQKNYLLSGLSEKEATEKALAYWQKTQHHTALIPVEKNTPRLVKYLQSKGIRVMALTARSQNIGKRTLQQLSQIGYNFRNSSALRQPRELTVGNSAALHVNGIVFAGGANKGTLLRKILSMSGVRPQRIIFVDDKSHHVEEVESALKGLGIRIETFRYGAADARVKSFNPAVAKMQATYLNRILSNQDAKAIIRAR